MLNPHAQKINIRIEQHTQARVLMAAILVYSWFTHDYTHIKTVNTRAQGIN